jgi:hypothetical protein
MDAIASYHSTTMQTEILKFIHVVNQSAKLYNYVDMATPPSQQKKRKAKKPGRVESAVRIS